MLKERQKATKKWIRSTGIKNHEEGNAFGTGFNMGWKAAMKHVKKNIDFDDA